MQYSPVGAAEGCDLLILPLILKSQSQKIAAFGSSYRGSVLCLRVCDGDGAFLQGFQIVRPTLAL
jgi:hypothetical protein